MYDVVPKEEEDEYSPIRFFEKEFAVLFNIGNNNSSYSGSTGPHNPPVPSGI